MSDPPAFTAEDKPKSIVAGAGAWLAREMGDGFTFKRSRQELARLVGGRTEAIVLQSSTWSRGGEGTWVAARVIVTDQHVRDWLNDAANELKGLFSSSGFVFNTLLINIGIHDIELYGPFRKQEPGTWLSLTEFVEVLRTQVLPHVVLLRESPSIAAEKLPSRWIWASVESLFCWSVAQGDRNGARLFLSRYLEATPMYRRNFDRGRQLAVLEEAPPRGNSLVALGWSAVRSGMLLADEPI